MEDWKDYLLFVFKIIISLSLILFLLFGVRYYYIKIDESQIEKIKYCPSCGICLISSK